MSPVDPHQGALVAEVPGGPLYEQGPDDHMLAQLEEGGRVKRSTVLLWMPVGGVHRRLA